MQQQQHAVDRVRHDRDLEDVAPSDAEKPKLLEKAHARSPALVSRCMIAQATSSACRLGATSCTRKMRAPRCNAATFAPRVACTRAAASVTPVISPRNRLRDAP